MIGNPTSYVMLMLCHVLLEKSQTPNGILKLNPQHHRLMGCSLPAKSNTRLLAYGSPIAEPMCQTTYSMQTIIKRSQ